MNWYKYVVGCCKGNGRVREGEKVKEWRTKTSRTFGSRIIGGAPYSTCTPPAPTPTSKYYQRHSRRSDSSGARAPGQAELGTAGQVLAGARRRWAFSEVSLSPMVAGNLVTKQSRRGVKGRGEWERADKGSGRGSGKFDRRKEGIWWRDLNRGGGGASGHVRKSTVAELQTS